METQQLLILVTILTLLFCYGCRRWLLKWVQQLLSACTSPEKKSSIVTRPYFRIKLPRTMDFDGAIVTVTAGGKRHTQINPQKEGVGVDQVLHFDLGGEHQVDSVEIYTPQDDKKYDFLAPPVNTTFEMPAPMAYFDYYESDYLKVQGL